MSQQTFPHAMSQQTFPAHVVEMSTLGCPICYIQLQLAATRATVCITSTLFICLELKVEGLFCLGCDHVIETRILPPDLFPLMSLLVIS